MKENVLYPELSYRIVGLLYGIHNTLGYSRSERQYADAFEEALRNAGIPYQREVRLPPSFPGEQRRGRTIVDFLIDGKIVVELKAKSVLTRSDDHQTKRYLQALGLELGILVNFRRRYLAPKRVLVRSGSRSFGDSDIIRGFGLLSSGFTLIELIIYVAVFSLVVAMAALFFLSTLRGFLVVRADQAVVANAALAMKTMEFEVRQADRLYPPTSVFDSDAGQLSVRTPRSAPTDHRFAYVDFYLDNGTIYEKRDDGTNPVALTSGDVEVLVLRFERYASGAAEGVRITITAQPRNLAAAGTISRTFRSFVVLRTFSP